MTRKGGGAIYTRRQLEQTRAYLVATLARLEAEHERLTRLLAIYRQAEQRARLEHPGDC